MEMAMDSVLAFKMTAVELDGMGSDEIKDSQIKPMENE